MTVSLSQEGGAGLGAAWGAQTAGRMLHEAGFAQVEVKGLAGDFINNYSSPAGCDPNGQITSRHTMPPAPDPGRLRTAAAGCGHAAR